MRARKKLWNNERNKYDCKYVFTSPIFHVLDFLFCCSSNIWFCYCLTIEKSKLSFVSCPFSYTTWLPKNVSWNIAINFLFFSVAKGHNTMGKKRHHSIEKMKKEKKKRHYSEHNNMHDSINHWVWFLSQKKGLGKKKREAALAYLWS